MIENDVLVGDELPSSRVKKVIYRDCSDVRKTDCGADAKYFRERKDTCLELLNAYLFVLGFRDSSTSTSSTSSRATTAEGDEIDFSQFQ